MRIFLLLTIVALFSASCDDFLTPSVDQNIPAETVIQSEAELGSLILGIHDELNSVALYGRDIFAVAEVMSDNAFSNANSNRFVTESRFELTIQSGSPAAFWENFYQSIATANTVINDTSVEETARVLHFKGQAYALRALAHFQLLLFFGQQFVDGSDLGIPYITTYREGNDLPARNTVQEVLSNVLSDLELATQLMDTQFDSDATVMNYYAARALQSRVALYTADFALAIEAADDVINNSGLRLTDSSELIADWASGSGQNSLFEMAFTVADRPQIDNLARIYRPSNYGDVEATEDLYNAYDDTDARKELMVFDGTTYRMINKYVNEVGNENVRIIRYAEVLLNKAEALARRGSGNDLSEAISIINLISSTNASSRVYTSTTQADVINDVLNERRLELAFEGHRFFDLARHGRDIPNVPVRIPDNTFDQGNSQSLPFGDYRFALPIPLIEMDANSSMVQNQGYN